MYVCVFSFVLIWIHKIISKASYIAVVSAEIL